MYCGFDVGSTTNKYVVCADDGTILSKAYERHGSRQAEKVLESLQQLEKTHQLTSGDRILLTGSGAGLIAPLVGGRLIQEVVAVAAAVEQLHPSVRFVSEIGGEDMKTIFFSGAKDSRTKQVFMQAACSGGTGTFIEKTARKLGVIDQLPGMKYSRLSLHKLSSKCGIFAEADSNTLVKAGVPVDEIIASLFEATVYQNLSTLTKGNTPMPEVLLLGGPNLFFTGLQEAWRAHLKALWHERQVALPPDRDPDSLIVIPADALFYAALGCVEIARGEPNGAGIYRGIERLQWWVSTGQHEQKLKEGRQGLCESPVDVEELQQKYRSPQAPVPTPKNRAVIAESSGRPAIIGCDFGSTTAKAVCLSPEREIIHKTYVPSKGNPIEDSKLLFREIRNSGIGEVLGLGITGYGADVLKNILGADVSIVETVAHATSALHYFPDADCICDVGGMDIKILLIKNGKVSDFRLNSQCSSGNGAFLQGVAERFNIPLAEIAERAMSARALPRLTMGCGVFLQSDIVNQQRKGWSADEILGGLCAIVPLNVWIYAGGLTNLASIGKKFILQGGTHLNVAVVKAQADFIQSKLPDAEIVVHPYSGEAGAIGAALCARDKWESGTHTGFRGFHVIDALIYNATTSAQTVCTWCPVDCRRTFVDVEIPGAKGRPWSSVPLPQGWERVITNNSCPKGLVEDVTELRITKAEMERVARAYPNIAEMVRKEAFCTKSF